jgi:hypothetical protein
MDFKRIYEMNMSSTTKLIRIINSAKSLASWIKENSREDSEEYKKADDLLRSIDRVEF